MAKHGDLDGLIIDGVVAGLWACHQGNEEWNQGKFRYGIFLGEHLTVLIGYE